MKKGSLMSEPFTYILIAVVIALIAFFGFKYVKELTDFGCGIGAKKFVMDFRDDVANMMSFSTGSKSKEVVDVPSGVVAVCFLDPSVSSVNLGKIDYIDIKQEVSMLVESGTLKEQMFFSKGLNANDQCIPDRTRIENLRVAGSVKCFDTSSGKMTLFLENKGKFIELSDK